MNNETRKKYFRRQTPYYKTDTQCEPFIDPFFPPKKISICTNDYQLNALLGIHIDDIEWKTLNIELLFPQRFEFKEISSSLIESPFMTALKFLIEWPSLIFKIFASHGKVTSVCEYYELLLFIDGEWQYVIIDAYFPIYKIKNEPVVFSSSLSDDSLWTFLLEKAWAKINGGYLNALQETNPCEIIHAFTGFPCESRRIREIPGNEIWKLVRTSQQEIRSFAYSESDSLVKGNYYPIMGIRQVNMRNHEVIVIKNHTLKQIESEDAFELELEEFILKFSQICIIHILESIHSYDYIIQKSLSLIPDVIALEIKDKEIDKEILFSISSLNWKFSRTLMSANIKYQYFIIISQYIEEANSLTFISGKCTTSANDLIRIPHKVGRYIISILPNCEDCSDPMPEYYIFRILSHSNSIKLSYHQSKIEHYDIIRQSIQTKIMQDHSHDIQHSEEGEEIYSLIHSNFYSTKIGYAYIRNNTHNKNFLVDLDIQETKNMKVIGKSNRIILPAKNSHIIISLTKDLESEYSFNVAFSYQVTVKEATKNNSCAVFDSKIIYATSGGMYQNYSFYSKLEGTDLRYKSHALLTEKEKLSLIKEYYPAYIDKLFELLNQFSTELSKYQDLHWTVLDEYDNGIYFGQKLNSKKEGIGMYIWNSGERYEGFWEKDMRSVKGTQFGPNEKIIYSGQLLNGKKHGIGSLYLPNGDIYQGSFANDCYQGPGIYYWKDGCSLQGNWENDKIEEGTGIIFLSEASKPKSNE